MNDKFYLFAPGNLLKNEKENIIVMVVDLKPFNEHCFSGVVLYADRKSSIGVVKTMWLKNTFTDYDSPLFVMELK